MTPVVKVLLVAAVTAVSVAGQSSGFAGYSYPKPTTKAPFEGYSYPKPTKPFTEGYTYTKPKCPLVLPSTVTDTQTIVTTALVTETLPPLTSTQFETSFVTLPPVVQTETETRTVFVTHTSTDLIVSTHTEILPTTVTSLLTTTHCQPNSYLPPPPPTPPPQPANTYLPAVDPPAKEYLPQPTAGGQQQPIKRATGERTELNEIGGGADEPAADQQSQPAINIIYVDRSPQRDGNLSADVPPADLMNWLLCKFNLTSGSCN